MPVVESRVVSAIEPEVAFWVSQTTGEVRYRWDTFVHRQELLGGATAPATGVHTATTSRHRLRMVSEYVSFAPPRNVGMRMVTGPWFFERFGGGWRFGEGETPGTSLVTWRYNFRTRPRLLSPIADRIGTWLLHRDIDARIAGYARGCEDPVVLEAARAAGASSHPRG